MKKKSRLTIYSGKNKHLSGLETYMHEENLK